MRPQILVLALLLSAGCLQAADTTDAAGLDVHIVVPDGTYYVGDVVHLRVEATATPEKVAWSFGDGSTGNGTLGDHAYLSPGSFKVQVRILAGGQVAEANTTIAVADLFAGFSPVGLPVGDDSGIVHMAIQGDEPTVGADARLRLLAPSFINGSGELRLVTDDDVVRTAFDVLPAVLDIPTSSPGRKTWAWSADIDNETFSGQVVFDVWGEPITFGEPTAEQWLRPGVHSEVCTVNFLFHYKWYRFFIGSAAHCVDSLELTQVCVDEPTGKIGKKETLNGHDASRSTGDAWVAYNSWLTMDRIRTSDGALCAGNDFALFELGPDAQKHMHPKAMGLGGPTALADAGYGQGTVLYGYGASNLHGNAGVAYPGQEEVNSKRGVSLGVENSGYSQHLYFAIPGVPGDSGGPAFGPNGEALGAASTVTITPTTGSNRYTVIPQALAFMEQHEGWRPELITWDDFQGV